ncbi:hypothetical protein P879_03035 [Paragonimus westermani]|uniref:G-protein coupled receptors family 1 profile domain-containing protein n=1 Tax=Paragonimus westermani TaxID=34504 RepID=A0A8T0D7U7_9TREM|nr:hypothetical protein P879_03035 [Paragonimus westermani]
MHNCELLMFASREPFKNLHADLHSMIPYMTQLLQNCTKSTEFNCQNNVNEYLNSDVHAPFDVLSVADLMEPCSHPRQYAWGKTREYTIAIAMGILGTVGLMGNFLSCAVIVTYLLKFSGTFVLFLFLSLADSLVVVMQIIDAYRNSVMVDYYTQISSEQLEDSGAVWGRDWSCKLFLFFWHFALQLAAWLVMALSVDRYSSLKHIHVTRNKSLVYRRAWIIGGVVVTLLIMFNLPFLVYTKSVVYKMPCGFSHFCIYTAWSQTTWSQGQPSNGTNSTIHNSVHGYLKQENTSFPSIHPIYNQASRHSSRAISLWLSRQHLVVFGLIPYTVTFVFNIILIMYLRSSPHPVSVCRNRTPSLPENDQIVQPVKRTITCGVSGRKTLFGQSCCQGLRKINGSNKRKSIGVISLVSVNEKVQMKTGIDENKDYRAADRCGLLPLPHSRAAQSTLEENMSCDSQLTGNNPSEKNNSLFIPLSELCPPNKTLSSKGNTHSVKDNVIAEEAAHAKWRCSFGSSRNHEVDCAPRLIQQADVVGGKAQLSSFVLSRRRRSSSSSGWWIGQTRTTVLLLVVTFTFIGLTLPYMIYTEIKQFQPGGASRIYNFHTHHIFEELGRFLLFINNGLNFLVYMTGRQFRKGFRSLIYRIRASLCSWSLEHRNQWYRHPPNRQRNTILLISNRNGGQTCKLKFTPNLRDRCKPVRYTDSEALIRGLPKIAQTNKPFCRLDLT